jgi:hypothetical protein
MSLSMQKINNQIKTQPLSKKQAKQQFIEKTKEFNLQHSFNFDEAWDYVKHKKKQKDFEEKITLFEKAVTNHDNSLGAATHEVNPTKHSFADGQYVREIYNPAGLILVTKIHNQTHPFFLMKGEMTILTEDGPKTIKAPYHGITKAGTKRIIFTHTECIFVTVHKTESLTIAEIEKEVIAESFDKVELDNLNVKEIEKLIMEFSLCLG